MICKNCGHDKKAHRENECGKYIFFTPMDAPSKKIQCRCFRFENDSKAREILKESLYALEDNTAGNEVRDRIEKFLAETEKEESKE